MPCMAIPGSQGMHLATVSARGSITSTEKRSVAGELNVYSINTYEVVRVAAYFLVKIERHCLDCVTQLQFSGWCCAFSGSFNPWR
jgi:hypothetical protein